MHWIEQVFGTSDLYAILNSPKDATRSALRKAYYRSALQHHPDKGNGDPQRFQALSLAYQILENPERRAEYDETGVIPGDDEDLDEHTNQAGVQQWKDYFDKIFGRVTTSKIDAFAQKYKCSDEEARDVLAAFVKCRGNLVKMIDIVLVSEFRDAQRWVDDYLQPALQEGKLDKQYEAAMKKSLKLCQKKAEQQDEETETEDEEDADHTMESEPEGEIDEEDDDEDDPVPKKKSKPSTSKGNKATKVSPKKKSTRRAGKTKSKPKMDDLVAAIQNKKRGNSSSIFASLGARYGVNLNDDHDDPLGNDEAFEKAQAKLLSKSKNKTTKSKKK